MTQATEREIRATLVEQGQADYVEAAVVIAEELERVAATTQGARVAVSEHAIGAYACLAVFRLATLVDLFRRAEDLPAIDRARLLVCARRLVPFPGALEVCDPEVAGLDRVIDAYDRARERIAAAAVGGR